MNVKNIVSYISLPHLPHSVHTIGDWKPDREQKAISSMHTSKPPGLLDIPKCYQVAEGGLADRCVVVWKGRRPATWPSAPPSPRTPRLPGTREITKSGMLLLSSPWERGLGLIVEWCKTLIYQAVE